MGTSDSDGMDFRPLLTEEMETDTMDMAVELGSCRWLDFSDAEEFCLSNIGVTGVENAGGGLIMGPLSDIGDSSVTSGGGVGGNMGDGSVMGTRFTSSDL